ncbi:MAG: hypothetical protein JWO36_5978 [Myxococcales bacterium]|nr:hypothetical protein [Myxococcales bacterium]
MSASIGGMMLVMYLTGVEAPAPVTVVMFVVAGIIGVVLARVLRPPHVDVVAAITR